MSLGTPRKTFASTVLAQRALDQELLAACKESKDHGKIQSLLEAGADPDSVHGEISQQTPLLITKSPETIRLLLEAGADPNKKGKLGSTPLHEQAYLHQTFSCKLLIEAGADVNAVDSSGYTAIHNSLLLFRGEPEQIWSTIKALLDAGADVNQQVPLDAKNNPGYTALHFAAESLVGKKLIGQLMAAGGNPKIKTAKGSTPKDICHSDSLAELEWNTQFQKEENIRKRLSKGLELDIS